MKDEKKKADDLMDEMIEFMEKKPRKLFMEDLERARIGQRYWNVTRDEIPDTCTYKAKICSYVDNIEHCIDNGIGLLLKGTYSMGKTGAAVVILKAAMAHCKTALFLAVREMCAAVLGNQIFDNDAKETLIHRAKSVDCLLLDDLGDEAEAKSDFVPALIEGVIRYRSDRKLTTIITTNLNEEAIGQRYGESTLQVLKGCTISLKCEGHNWRQDEATKMLRELRKGNTK